MSTDAGFDRCHFWMMHIFLCTLCGPTQAARSALHFFTHSWRELNWGITCLATSVLGKGLIILISAYREFCHFSQLHGSKQACAEVTCLWFVLFVVVVLLREATAVCMTIHVRSRGVAFLAESQLCVCSWEDDINSVGVKDGGVGGEGRASAGQCLCPSLSSQ